MEKLFAILLAGVAVLPIPAAAQVIAINQPAQTLSEGRISTLPDAAQAPWRAYLLRSEAQRRADRAALAAELAPGQPAPPPPQAFGGGEKSMPLDRDAKWYASAEARHMADTIVSFQTPAGGWSKNQNRAGAPRLPGQRFANDAETMVQDPANFDAPQDRFWTFVGTLDNGATTTEMRFLARVAAALPGEAGARYRQSFVDGVRYLLAAQYPNGGWPQIWPLEGGFHDGITFNDDAVAKAAMLLEDVAEEPALRFVPEHLREQAARAVSAGVKVILAAQVRQNGRLAGWPQQIDPLTLEPISARNYEPRSIASAETTDILLFLMRQREATPEIRAAVEGGVAWLKASAVTDHAWTKTPEGRKLIPQPGGGPLWSRNYDVVTGKPIFGDKDRTIHADVNGISVGRRNGYNWWVTNPQHALDAYPSWAKKVSG
ncbi:PelA/Pel-15E family pectate lyase [Sphingomonas naasensis]|uniref:Pectate lyase n=1 Tax=Sphingomonas naasensis TaxID=1344951 RepID=A0A4S1WNG1_9SPHN|nr:pectate lyase [Sphingomonas naasensis]NIJ21066.1 PelA/Pel-15E family pectate lyase [Sphingomonas naasensis]TGX43440.1 pectate lyase [Sphingomonas naasensis]